MPSLKYLVLWKNGNVGGFARSDICGIAIATHREEVVQIFMRGPELETVFNPITLEDFDNAR